MMQPTLTRRSNPSLGNDAASNDDKILSESYFQFADHYHRLLKEIEIASENKNTELNGQKSEDLVEPVENDSSNYEKKPSRKERSIKAKFKEDEGKVNKDDSPDNVPIKHQDNVLHNVASADLHRDTNEVASLKHK